MLTSPTAYEWMQTTIKADVTLQTLFGGTVRCFQRNAPEGLPSYPFVLLRWVSGVPVIALGAEVVWTSAVMDAIVVDKSNSTFGMKEIANRLDIILHKKNGSTSDGTVFFCSMAEDYSEIATTDPPSPGGGARVQNLGRTWRLIVGAG